MISLLFGGHILLPGTANGILTCKENACSYDVVPQTTATGDITALHKLTACTSVAPARKHPFDQSHISKTDLEKLWIAIRCRSPSELQNKPICPKYQIYPKFVPNLDPWWVSGGVYHFQVKSLSCLGTGETGDDSLDICPALRNRALSGERRALTPRNHVGTTQYDSVCLIVKRLKS